MKRSARRYASATEAESSTDAPGQRESVVRQWAPFEIELAAGIETTNPYVEGLPDSGQAYVKTIFRQEGGRAGGRQYAAAGFWDGGRTWRVRFAPPLPGKWSYRTFSKDPGLDGKEGRFVCKAWTEQEKRANPARRGFVRVCKEGARPGRYFEYADGTPFLWLGDTWWNWTRRGIAFDSFRKVADDRSRKGFNIGQLFFAGKGWSMDCSLLDAACTHPDIPRIRDMERMITYANSQGITVWVHGWWSQSKMKEEIGEVNIRRWWRYMIHRLAASNVIWALAGEYNMHNYGGLGLPFWKSLGKMVKREDPHDRLTSVHPTPPGWDAGDEAPQWSTAEVLHRERWLDYNQSQVGHGQWRNELIPWVVEGSYRRRPPKPIVVTEPWYEFIEGNPTGAQIRFGAWSAMLSGAAGHSYAGGHVWKAHVPESPVGPNMWPMELGFETDTLDYPGARSVSFMACFLRSLPWWELEPHPELVMENASRYCAASPGKRYLVYLRWGGAVKVDLRRTSAKDRFSYEWLDLANTMAQTGGIVHGGAVRTFHAPDDYPATPQSKDWVLHIHRRGGKRG